MRSFSIFTWRQVGLLVAIEPNIDRIERHEGGQQGLTIGYQIAQSDIGAADAAADGEP